MNHEPRRCIRPSCPFAPLPELTENGGLTVSDFCSTACVNWLQAAIENARCDDSTDVERQAHRLTLVGELLNLRDSADDMTFFTVPTPIMAPVTVETEA
ncbi:hypothetical protein [Streptomyces naphthomycinicus]|uniref:hypothetical protein n=1 Tax=Streptomyces naphthomycinicus TaxID=2872625 RepID=UPI001CECE674|nr:hypothetical protein [Streptomyces sp. TML10]